MSRRTGSALLLAALALPVAAGAGEVRLTAELERAEVALGEAVGLLVRLEADEAPAEVELPRGGEAFRVASSSASQETQVTLGGAGLAVRRVSVWRLAIEPLREGRVVIPGPVAVVGGERHAHRDLELLVSGAPAEPPDDGSSPDDRPRPRGSASWTGWQRDLSVRLRLDRKQAFVGEQVTAVLELVSPVELLDWAFRPPALEGFWSEDLHAKVGHRVERAGGVPLRIYTLRKLALFPVRPGALTIEPAELDFKVKIASRDRLGLFPEVRTVRRRSRPVSLVAKPLPPGAPMGFEPGNVGAWGLRREGPTGKEPAGEPLSVKLIARGTGNLRALSLPRVPEVRGLSAFDAAPVDEVELQGDRFGGTRTVETPVALEREGAVVLPAVEWPYFDPRTGRYQVARLPELRLEAGPPRRRVATGGDAALAAELRPLRSGGELSAPRPPAWRTNWFLGATAAPPVLFLALALGAWLRDGLSRGAGDRRRRGAAGLARRRLTAARRRLAAGDSAAANEEAARALEGYAADRLGVPVGGLTREALALALSRAGARGPAAGLLQRALEASDAARFGGAASMEEVVSRAEEAVALLEEVEWRPGGGA